MPSQFQVGDRVRRVYRSNSLEVYGEYIVTENGRFGIRVEGLDGRVFEGGYAEEYFELVDHPAVRKRGKRYLEREYAYA